MYKKNIPEHNFEVIKVKRELKKKLFKKLNLSNLNIKLSL